MRIKVIATVALLMLELMAQSCCTNNIIKVQGNAEVKVNPDVAIITVRVSNQHIRSSDALAQVNAGIARLLDVLDGFSISKEDYSTSSFSIDPNYEFILEEKILTGQRAQQTLAIRVRDLT